MIVKHGDLTKFVDDRGLLAWSVLTAAGSMKDGAWLAALNDGKDGEHEIALLVNGHALPVDEAFAEAERQYDQIVKDAAEELLRDRLDGIEEKAREAVEELTRGLRQFAEDHGIEFSEDEEW